MKRSDLFIRLMTGVIFLAVAVYGGVILYDSLTNSFETTEAVRLTVEEPFPAEGYIVRTETVLSEFSSAVLPIVREGEKVASGQAIAIEYFSRDALETAGEIRALTMKLAQLESSGRTDDLAGRAAILSLSSAVHTRDFRRLDEVSLDIETGIFVTETDVQILRDRLDELELRDVNAKTIYAPVSGNFSQVVDGFEHITLSVIGDLLPSDLRAHFRMPLDESGAGKLVTSHEWHYAAVMHYDDAARLSVGQTKTVQFSGSYQAHVDMQIRSIGRREGDSCVVLFSSDRAIHEVASQRSLRAEIINDVISGIRIPKEAVRLENQGNEVVEYIYLQTSGYAERVNIERIPPEKPFETTDSYLVRDGAETGSPLRAGSTIIVRANNLYHGKVVG